MKNRQLKFSVNADFYNKNQLKQKAFNQGFVAVTDTIENLADAINTGWAFSYEFLGGIRKSTNFIATDILAVDIDYGLTIKEALANTIVKKYCSIFYTTATHNLDHHRFRLIFALPRTITDPKELKSATTSLSRRLGGDLSATDAARIFFGSSGSNPLVFENSIDAEFLDELLKDGLDVPVSDSIAYNKTVAVRARGNLPNDYIFQTSDKKPIQATQIVKTTPVYCPFHNDDNPSAFLSNNNKGFVFLHCSTCQITRWIDKNPEFDFNDFENSLRKFKTNPPSEDYDTRNLIEELFGDDIELNRGGIVFTNNQFLKLKTIHKGLTFIKSPKGTGKTTFLKRALRKILVHKHARTLEAYEENSDFETELPIYTNKRALLIGHRQALIREMCQGLGLDCYLDYPFFGTRGINKQRRYGVCLDSLNMAIDKRGTENPTNHKVSLSDISTVYDVVIIDESEQVLAHFLSETIGGKRISIFNDFKNIIKNAKSVVLLDADLSWLSFNTISKLAFLENKKPPIRIYINNWAKKQIPIFVYPTSSQLLEHLKQSISLGKVVYVSSNSKTKIRALEKAILILAKELKKDIPMITITSANSKTEAVQTFITNIKKEIKNYKVILSSPSLGTGIDITFDNQEQYVDCIYGFYENRVNTHTEIDQQLARVRHPKETHVWVSGEKFNFETEFQVVRSDRLEGDFLTKTYNLKELEEREEQFDQDGAYLTMATLITVQQRASKNNLRANFLKYKKDQGCEIVYVDSDDNLRIKGRDFYKAGKKELDAEAISNILTARVLDEYPYNDIEYRLSSNDLKVSQDEYYSFLRTRMELFYGEPATEKLIKKDSKSRLRWGIRNFEYLTDKSLIKLLFKHLEDERNARGVDIVKEQIIPENSKVIILLYELLSSTPIFKDGTFKPSVYFSLNDLGEFINVSKKLKTFVENHLKLNTRSDLDQKATQHLWQILKLVGIGPWKRMKKTVGGKATYFYRISIDDVDFAKTVIMRKNQNLTGWSYLNGLYGSKRWEEDRPWEYFRNKYG
jgi:hypothetical protein